MNRSDLLNLHCREISPSEGCLSDESAASLRAELPFWHLAEKRIERKFRFGDFKAAIDFINGLAQLAEKEQHHPDILIHYNHVTISSWTHTVGGVTMNDFILAAKIDSLYDACALTH